MTVKKRDEMTLVIYDSCLEEIATHAIYMVMSVETKKKTLYSLLLFCHGTLLRHIAASNIRTSSLVVEINVIS